MLTCTLVSFFHGSNDGQKGMGLMMLILVGLVPGAFALNMASDSAQLKSTAVELRKVADQVTSLAKGATLGKEQAVAELTRYDKAGGVPSEQTYAALVLESQSISTRIEQIQSMDSVARDERVDLRTDIYLVAECLGKLVKGKRIGDPAVAKQVESAVVDLNKIVKYIPLWVKVAVALALGLGTMIGWKRIVVTVGEKIGKSHLTYAQGDFRRIDGCLDHRPGRLLRAAR